MACFGLSNKFVICPTPDSVVCLPATESSGPEHKHMYNSKGGTPPQDWTSNYYSGTCADRPITLQLLYVGTESGNVTCTYQSGDSTVVIFQTRYNDYCLNSQVNPNISCPSQATKTLDGDDCMIYSYPQKLSCQPFEDEQ